MFLFKSNKPNEEEAYFGFTQTIKHSKYLYKSVNRDWIVTFETFPDTIIRHYSHIVPSKFIENRTLFTADKLKVVNITHKTTNKNSESIDFYYQSPLYNKYGIIKLKLNDIIIENVFERTKENDGLYGIHVVKTYETAYLYEAPTNYTGKMSIYRRVDGTLQATYYMVNGKKHGLYTSYQTNEVDIDRQTNYIDGREYGVRNTYFGISPFRNQIVLSEKIKNGRVIEKTRFDYNPKK